MVRKYKKNKGTEPEDDEPIDINRHVLEPEEDEEDLKPERPATAARKQQFLKLFPQHRLIVVLTCKEMHMSQHTFYTWYDTDKDFAAAVDKARVHTNQRVRDLLMKKIEEGETRAITYYLDRKDPEYKPTTKTEVVTGSKTLEDILKADEEKGNGNFANTKGDKANDDSAGVDNEGGASSPGPEVSTGEVVQDPGQKGEAPAVSPEQDSTVLLEKEDAKKPDSQGAPEGNIEGDRRRPIDRLRTKRN